MKSIIITGVLIMIITSSCNTVRVCKNNSLFKIKANFGHLNTTTRYTNDKPFTATLTVKDDYIIISPQPPDSILTYDTTVELAAGSHLDKLSIKTLYFGETEFPLCKHFKYKTITGGIQAITVPIKIRPALSDKAKYPSLVETGINIGFAPSVKFSLNSFSTSKNFLGKNLTTYSLTCGGLLNLGTTDLDSAKNAPGLAVNRKALTFSYGGFVLFGFNNINFGYALGWDNVSGTGKKNWVYQGHLWHGIIISLDIVKF